jgi:hypothetical protein
MNVTHAGAEHGRLRAQWGGRHDGGIRARSGKNGVIEQSS